MTSTYMTFINEDAAYKFYNDLLDNLVEFTADLPMFDGTGYIVYYRNWSNE